MPNKTGGSRGEMPRTFTREKVADRLGRTPRISYDIVLPELLHATVVAVVEAGGAIMFARTSDGGALAVTLYYDDERIRAWPHTQEETETVLQEAIRLVSPSRGPVRSPPNQLQPDRE